MTKKNRAGVINLLDFRLKYKAKSLKAVWYWHKNRNIDQLDKIKRPETNPYTYWHLTFDKGGKNTQWRKASSISDTGKTGQVHVKGPKLNTS